MHAAPVLRGGRAARAVWLVAGLFFCACGIVAFLESRLGLPPWDVLHQGIANHTPLSFGLANESVAVVVLFLAWSLGSRPGPGTLANAALIGLFVVLVQPLGFVQDLESWPLAAARRAPGCGTRSLRRRDGVLHRRGLRRGTA